ncbi:FtsX-like permease family protein [Pedococcus bigeumensis]|uniref:ABC transporter permease n=1 Tax=Pedococcus bigeumensis TaxID=433644 RepID=A0A502CYW9_9MICO|nr:ABC transporter permease [Pedococcus bigeumensis]TPG17349.1 ABC transporter permease [Pedococcus bigeumensis]
MRTSRWLTGLVRRRPFELLVAAVSIMLTVAFVASLGAFVTQSHAALTVRAAASVPVDWQVQVTPQGDPAAVERQVRKVPGVRVVEDIAFARVDALQSSGPQGSRSTGAAYVVAVSPAYATTFPGEVRHLLGSTSGTMLFQQTAANLAAEPGARISVRTASGAKSLTVDGVVDLPAEDSLFQVVGLAPGAGVSAPPDNVVLVTPEVFRSVVGRTPVVHQIHVGFAHGGLPADPQAATVAVQGRANHFQAAVAGGALVGDNLGTALSQALEDARYANLLFLLLGLPGLALSAVVAALVVSLRSDRRRREVALLRLRGATLSQILRVLAGEALVVAFIGGLLGVPLSLLAIRLALPAGTTLSLGWMASAIAGGVVLALATQTGPVVALAFGRDRTGVAAEASRGQRTGSPWALRAGLDVILLAGAALSFALTSRSGYQVVLAPEGIPQTQINYGALVGPALAWPGLALLVWRLTAWTTGRRTGRWSRAGAGAAPELEAAALRHRRRVVARGAAGLAVALGLAVSTATFTATYDAQARLDVALTVGSDVAVVEPPGATVGPDAAAGIARTAGVDAVEPLQHRFGYVGPDLQDLFGVNASSFARVGPLQDAFVPGSTITKTLAALQARPDGVLLSAETLHDYQLHPGDLIRIRLQSGRNRAYRPVDFHVVGQVTEWPTAPKDSFIVANASYIAQRTGSDAVGTFLVSSKSPAATAAALRANLAGTTSGARVQDISSAGSHVTSASGLAGTDLSGLSRLELGFGVLLALACSGLALLGGILERRRALVLLAALGATPRQRGRFLAGEARAMVVAGVLGGAVTGATIAYMLVKVLTGIFDPAPASATVPWGYLALLLGVVAFVTATVVSGVGRLVARAGPSQLRDL